MKAIFILIIISLLAAIGFLFAFIWAVKTGQYEDDYTPSVRILFDDDQPGKTHKLDLNNNETPAS
jgi:cbb3-type cytochrome oxidase maturation protein